MNHLITFRSSVLLVAFAAAVAVLLVVATDRQAGAQIAPDIDFVAVDLDPSGNTATSIGAGGAGIDAGDIQSSVGNVTVGATVPFDIVVDEVPSPGIFGAAMEVNYDPAIVEVTAVNRFANLLQYSGAGASLFGGNDLLPDKDGSFRVDSVDLGGNDETGPGTVLQVTVKCIAAGTTPITLTDAITGGGDNAGILNQSANFTIGTELEALIGCGGPVVTPTPPPVPTGTLTVNKDFSDVNASAVSVTVTCDGGATASPSEATAVTEAAPVDFTITLPAGPASCTATESPVPAGYAESSDCTGVLISSGITESCTITNTETTATITVSKVFSDGNPSAVTIGVICDSGVEQGGADDQASDPAGSAGDATFTIVGFNEGDTCTVSESGVPAGYANNAAAPANDCDDGVTLTDSGTPSCTFVNEPSSTTFTINKDFSDDNAATVNINIACTGTGTINPPSGWSFTEAAPQVVTVTAFDSGDTCTVTETDLQAGYQADTGCTGVTLVQGSTDCTITNDAVSTVSVFKDFDDDNQAEVTISLICTLDVTVTAIDDTAVEAAGEEAVFTVSGYGSAATCRATEAVPAGYTPDESDCTTLDLTAGNTPSCTITNTLNRATFTVNKDFSDKPSTDTTNVSVTLACDTGVVTPASASASEASPAVFTVTGFTPDPNCTATESPIPEGYSSSGTCNAALMAVGQCTITNANAAVFTVEKDFVPDDGASVTVSLTCDTGVATPASASASEASAAVFTVTGFTDDPNCTATESPIPAGYTSSGTCNADLVAVGTCMITNTLNSATFTVNKDFVPDDGAPVTVSLTCATGVVSPASASASEASAAVFTVTGFTPDPN